MKQYLLLLFTGLLAFAQGQSPETPEAKAARMQWFKDAKLGIFIHWGIYAVNGTDESWAFYNEKVPYDDYMAQMKGFTASKYDPGYWASLIAQSGAKYAVLTSKHHDGVALWDTKEDHYNVVDNTPAGRDLLTPFTTALRQNNVKVGMYFSLIDWSHPDYPGWTRVKSRYEASADSVRWNRFRRFCHAQIAEVTQRFRPDLYWFDGDWEHSAEEWQAETIRQDIFAKLPNTIINSRLQGYGDYDTPEQGAPISRPKATWWELCMTTNDNWGFQHRDTNFKSPNQMLRIFADCISMGGNLLMDIGPREDGTIPPEQVAILEEFGRWTKKHDEAIFGSLAGLPSGHYYGPSTLSNDKKTLYLFLTERPTSPLPLKGIKTGIAGIRIVGQPEASPSWKIYGKLSWSDKPGIIYISIPESALDPQITVVAIDLLAPLEIYREDGIKYAE